MNIQTNKIFSNIFSKMKNNDKTKYTKIITYKSKLMLASCQYIGFIYFICYSIRGRKEIIRNYVNFT